MNTILAKSAGFCFGVQRAVDTVYEELEKSDSQVYTYGPIIHNKIVVSDLEDKGLKVINSEDELADLKEGTVIIRSHGVGRNVIESLDRDGIRTVDATCPFVKRIHRLVEDAGRKGRSVIITGDPDHPEVQGITGWACGPCCVIRNKEDIEKLGIDKNSEITVVSQTTFNSFEFQDLVEILQKMDYHISVANTICNATMERQEEARDIAKKVDAMIVIGDIHSSNTQKLYEICKQECEHTYLIETLVDLEQKPFQSFCQVGITAGASTPKKIIEEVQNHVRREF